jgi:hypothetical protein
MMGETAGTSGTGAETATEGETPLVEADDDAGSSLVTRADAALYAAKGEGGRNCARAATSSGQTAGRPG